MRWAWSNLEGEALNTFVFSCGPPQATGSGLEDGRCKYFGEKLIRFILFLGKPPLIPNLPYMLQHGNGGGGFGGIMWTFNI